MYIFWFSAFLRLLRLRMKKKMAMKSKMRATPPITPPMIGLLSMVFKELEDPTFDVELGEELDDRTLVEVGVMLDGLGEVEFAPS